MENSHELPVKFIYEDGDSLELAFYETLTKPICCGKEMYSSGGVLGNTGTPNIMIENYWKCEKCGKEINDIIF